MPNHLTPKCESRAENATLIGAEQSNIGNVNMDCSQSDYSTILFEVQV